MDVKLLGETLATLNREFHAVRTELDRLPRTEGQLSALLEELEAADQDKAQHFKRYPRTEGGDTYDSPGFPKAEVEADWSRVLRRFDKAVQDLVLFARVRRQEAA